MREALAASNIDFSPRDERSAKGKQRAKPGKAKRAPLWRRVIGARGSFGSLLLVGFVGVVAIGVPVNALFMQDGRRPAKSIALNAPQAEPQRQSQAAPRPRAAAPALAKMDAQKSEPLQAEATKAAEKPVDGIGQWLKGGAPQKSAVDPKSAPKSDPKSDPKNKAVIFAQRALAKLGYSLHQDGVYGGTTRQAIEKFERSSGLPVKGELSPKILHLLGARAGVALR